MKKKKIEISAWILLDSNGDVLTCHCHPSKRTAYVVYKIKPPAHTYNPRYWKKVKIIED